MEEILTIRPYQTLAYVIMTLTVCLILVKSLLLPSQEEIVFIGYSLALLAWSSALLKQQIIFTQHAVRFLNIPLDDQGALGNDPYITYTDIIACRVAPTGIEITTQAKMLKVNLSLSAKRLAELKQAFSAHGIRLNKDISLSQI